MLLYPKNIVNTFNKPITVDVLIIVLSHFHINCFTSSSENYDFYSFQILSNDSSLILLVILYIPISMSSKYFTSMSSFKSLGKILNRLDPNLSSQNPTRDHTPGQHQKKYLLDILYK